MQTVGSLWERPCWSVGLGAILLDRISNSLKCLGKLACVFAIAAMVDWTVRQFSFVNCRERELVTNQWTDELGMYLTTPNPVLRDAIRRKVTLEAKRLGAPCPSFDAVQPEVADSAHTDAAAAWDSARSWGTCAD